MMAMRYGAIAACILALCCITNVMAATVCVLNKQTGRLEPLAGKGKTRECDGQAPAPATAVKAADSLSGKEEIVDVQVNPVPAPSEAPRAPLAVQRVAQPAFDLNTKHDWTIRTDHHTLEEVIADFASQVDYEVVYEAREFPLDLHRDLTIAKNANFWEALRVLGETYRNSDGAFQILPTKFKQIVVIPMGQSTTDAQK